jgi:hypothetical protein
MNMKQPTKPQAPANKAPEQKQPQKPQAPAPQQKKVPAK